MAITLRHLAASDFEKRARAELACAREFDLTVPGCCGTDQRNVEALARAAKPELPGFPLRAENF